jgi:hypothetical protein
VQAARKGRCGQQGRCCGTAKAAASQFPKVFLCAEH